MLHGVNLGYMFLDYLVVFTFITYVVLHSGELVNIFTTLPEGI